MSTSLQKAARDADDGQCLAGERRGKNGGRCGNRTRTGEARGILSAFRLPISASGLLQSTLLYALTTRVSHAQRAYIRLFLARTDLSA